MTSFQDGLDDELKDSMAMTRRGESLLMAVGLHGPLRVPTVDLRYEPRGYESWNGVKGGGPRGFGWNSRSIHSEYHLVVAGPEGQVEIRIDRAFKQAIGRLTPKRRDLIRRTMPPAVTLIKGDDPWYGENQVLVSSEELVRWVDEVKLMLSAGGKGVAPTSHTS
ncbi:MAG: hypothetical protein HYY17_13130 [Planctomycetes bacterium]|nr:hypothetical protein [Planctomycetota bacterium]